MSNPLRVNEAIVRGCRTVNPGDTVELVPNPSAGITFMKKWLGEGPYTIAWIGQWPCGRCMLYLKTTSGDNSGEPGAHADDFV